MKEFFKTRPLLARLTVAAVALLLLTVTIGTTLAQPTVERRVTFNPGQHGTVAEAERFVVHGEAIGELPTPAVTTLNQVFLGWFTNQGVQVTAETVITANTPLAARYAAQRRVTFNPTDGTVDEAERLVIHGEAIGELPVPARAGYAFTGWFTNTNVQVTADTVITANTPLVARWVSVPQHTVTFDPQSGSVDETSRLVYQGAAIGELPVPTRLNQVFLGWFTNQGVQVTADAIVSADMTLYAQWAVARRVTFNAGQHGTVDEAERVAAHGHAIGELPVPVVTTLNQVFLGWFTNQGVQVTADTVIAANTPLVARYAAQRRVTFNPGPHGAVDETERLVIHGEAIGELPVPTRAGHNTFAGWFTNQGVQVTADTVITANTPLVARWS